MTDETTRCDVCGRPKATLAQMHGRDIVPGPPACYGDTHGGPDSCLAVALRTARDADHEHTGELLADLAAEVSRLSAERDALAVSLAALREAARVAGHIAVIPYTDAGNEAARNLDAALAATASPAEHGARGIEEAEERGANWMAEAANNAVECQPGCIPGREEHHVACIRSLPSFIAVCRTAREPKGTR